MLAAEKLEDSKVVIRRRKLKDRQWNDQKTSNIWPNKVTCLPCIGTRENAWMTRREVEIRHFSPFFKTGGWIYPDCISRHVISSPLSDSSAIHIIYIIVFLNEFFIPIMLAMCLLKNALVNLFFALVFFYSVTPCMKCSYRHNSV